MHPFSSSSHERSACGVGFIVNRHGNKSHSVVSEALSALERMEHRGACGADGRTGDGAGIMTDIPFDLLGYTPGSVAVAALFMPNDFSRLRIALKVFEETFEFMGLRIIEYRDVPVDLSVLGEDAKKSLPTIKHAIIERPSHCRTDESFNKLLYLAKQRTRTRERSSGIIKEFFFTSLSTTTIVYKALTTAADLPRFYLDLLHPTYASRFALIHRRFSTNTRTSWDKAQPFRLIGHNGEINTIAGNRAWALSREQELGLPPDELLTHEGISDSGSLNEMVEALKYRSSIPRVQDILAIMMPPADKNNSYYHFWSRAMEPWDGPAFIAYSDGETIGARLDRNGFRPCRWTLTQEFFYLASEAGAFSIDEAKVLQKGALRAGRGVNVRISDGSVCFDDPSISVEHADARFDARTLPLFIPEEEELEEGILVPPERGHLFSYTDEEFQKLLLPMSKNGKEPIGSMGDTARLALFSDEPRSFFDFFAHNFAQVTNPPLDYLREQLVTDLVTYVGARPNIFAPKELIPAPSAVELSSPVLSLLQLRELRRLFARRGDKAIALLKSTWNKSHGTIGLRTSLRRLASEAIQAVEQGAEVLILSDRDASLQNLPIPSLLALRSVVQALNTEGLNLSASIIVDSGEIRETHHIATLIGFGATAVCPYLALSIVRSAQSEELDELSPKLREQHLLKSFQEGLLKIMSKMGISVVRSYQGSMLFTPIGIGQEILTELFPGSTSLMGGLTFAALAELLIKHASLAEQQEKEGRYLTTYLYKEHTKGTVGEKHSMTNHKSRLLHKILKGKESDAKEAYAAYRQVIQQDLPISPRHLLSLKQGVPPISLEEVEERHSITSRFGSGAMSFGAISAEAQRDIVLAMQKIGGRSNSGEGGENPYYYTHGITASVKQIASGRFGVTAEYLVSASEFQIKIAQGAKPGEGGQLMGVKVSPEIARARHSNQNVDLISPPPMHDIYSIEDLKQLIYELKNFRPEVPVSVKLVSGMHIGTIAVGVAKAGADIIHLSGSDGGTGAAAFSSMRHAGLPWEFGLVETHRSLLENRLRSAVRLRVDGGLHTGLDVVLAALLGADEVDFGKLLLVAQGCVMARVCEKNTCPAGIATHDPKFKSKYKGTVDGIVDLMHLVAEEVREHLSTVGLKSLTEACGRNDLLELSAPQASLIAERNIDLSSFLLPFGPKEELSTPLVIHTVSSLNYELLEKGHGAVDEEEHQSWSSPITTADRAIGATLSAAFARKQRETRLSALHKTPSIDTFSLQHQGGCMSVDFIGSAGQGFGVFLTEGIQFQLYGEANDSVGKGMSGGEIVITPQPPAAYSPERNTIIGNCALYGATGGRLFVHGIAGDRFAVRNSGAVAVVEGAGLHACEYMTNGTVVILGRVSHNVGAGMTGGTLYIGREQSHLLNTEYVTTCAVTPEEDKGLLPLLEYYYKKTGSRRAFALIQSWELLCTSLVRCVPLRWAAQRSLEVRNSYAIETKQL